MKSFKKKKKESKLMCGEIFEFVKSGVRKSNPLNINVLVRVNAGSLIETTVRDGWMQAFAEQ